MVRISVWAGAMQIPHGSPNVRWLQSFWSPWSQISSGQIRSAVFLGWVLAFTEGHAESCNLVKSHKRSMLGRLDGGLTHWYVGFLNDLIKQTSYPFTCEELSTDKTETAEREWYTHTHKKKNFDVHAHGHQSHLYGRAGRWKWRK